MKECVSLLQVVCDRQKSMKIKWRSSPYVWNKDQVNLSGVHHFFFLEHVYWVTTFLSLLQIAFHLCVFVESKDKTRVGFICVNMKMTS